MTVALWRVSREHVTLWISRDRPLETPSWSHHGRCILTSHQTTLQGSHMLALGWPIFRDSTALFCVSSLDDFILMSFGDLSQSNCHGNKTVKLNRPESSVGKILNIFCLVTKKSPTFWEVLWSKLPYNMTTRVGCFLVRCLCVCVCDFVFWIDIYRTWGI